jgi:hypothetical protein
MLLVFYLDVEDGASAMVEGWRLGLAVRERQRGERGR